MHKKQLQNLARSRKPKLFKYIRRLNTKYIYESTGWVKTDLMNWGEFEYYRAVIECERIARCKICDDDDSTVRQLVFSPRGTEYFELFWLLNDILSSWHPEWIWSGWLRSGQCTDLLPRSRGGDESGLMDPVKGYRTKLEAK